MGKERISKERLAKLKAIRDTLDQNIFKLSLVVVGPGVADLRNEALKPLDELIAELENGKPKPAQLCVHTITPRHIKALHAEAIATGDHDLARKCFNTLGIRHDMKLRREAFTEMATIINQRNAQET